MKRLVLWAVVVALTACAPRQYRLVVTNAVPTLIPPDGSGRKLRGGKCAAEAVDREALTKAPAGWLLAQAADRQAKGCLAPGGGFAWADAWADATALPLGVGHRLTHAPLGAGYLDLRPGYRLRVVSPILREGVRTAEVVVDKVESAPGGLAITARSSADLLGYETAQFVVGPGGFEPQGAEARVDGVVTRSAASRFRHFAFAPEARLFRMLFLTRRSDADRDALVVAARSEAEMERATRELNEAPGRCDAWEEGSFAVWKHGGGWTGRSGFAGGTRVTREFRGRPVPVRHDSVAILALPLRGGETASW